MLKIVEVRMTSFKKVYWQNSKYEGINIDNGLNPVFLSLFCVFFKTYFELDCGPHYRIMNIEKCSDHPFYLSG